MIPTIGIMIGFYIITKMTSLLMEKEERHSCVFPRILAIITILVTAFSILGLFIGPSLSQ